MYKRQGFGGLYAAKALGGAPVEVTLVDRANHHLFQPLLYQVATAGLSAPAIAAPVRYLFRDQPNLTTLMGEVTAIDAGQRQATLEDGTRLPYDHLIVAAGATWYSSGWNRWWLVRSTVVMARSAPCSARAASRPPKPQPTMRTRGRLLVEDTEGQSSSRCFSA